MSLLRGNNTLQLHSTHLSPSKLPSPSKPLTVFVAPHHRISPTIAQAAVTERMRIRVPPPAHPTYDISRIIKEALLEDAGDKGDVTSLATIPPQVQAEAQFLAKDSGIIAGIAMADLIFEEVDPSIKVEWNVQDGDSLTKGLHFGSVSGSARSILLAERVVLNFMQRMSGIATLTKIETRTLEEVREVLAHKGEGLGRVTRIMLDNMVVPLPDGSVDVSMLKQAIDLVNGQLETEASGNVTLGTVGEIGATGVTFISSGALTHSVKALDISLNIDTELALAVGRRTKRA